MLAAVHAETHQDSSKCSLLRDASFASHTPRTYPVAQLPTWGHFITITSASMVAMVSINFAIKVSLTLCNKLASLRSEPGPSVQVRSRTSCRSARRCLVLLAGSRGPFFAQFQWIGVVTAFACFLACITHNARARRVNWEIVFNVVTGPPAARVGHFGSLLVLVLVINIDTPGPGVKPNH